MSTYRQVMNLTFWFFSKLQKSCLEIINYFNSRIFLYVCVTNLYNFIIFSYFNQGNSCLLQFPQAIWLIAFDIGEDHVTHSCAELQEFVLKIIDLYFYSRIHTFQNLYTLAYIHLLGKLILESHSSHCSIGGL